MIFVVDMGNSEIVCGLFENGELITRFRTTTARHRSVDEYRFTIKELLFSKKIDPKLIKDTIVSSVVPQVTNTLVEALRLISKKKPIVLAPGVKSGVAIKTGNPLEVGSDLIATSAGANARYGYPSITLDLGTATKVCAIDDKGAFVGCVITPGVRVSADALVKLASQLPEIALIAPDHVIGTNTPDSMNAGMVYGHASMLDGFIARFRKEMKCDCKVIATGGLVDTIVPYCETKDIIIDRDLILYGLLEIYNKNKLKNKDGK